MFKNKFQPSKTRFQPSKTKIQPFKDTFQPFNRKLLPFLFSRQTLKSKQALQKFLAILLVNTIAISSAEALIPFTQGNSEFDGLYTGASVGLSNTAGKLTGFNNTSVTFMNFFAGVPGGPFIQDANTAHTLNIGLKKTAAIGAIYAGYGFSACNFYLGAETFFDGTNRKLNVSNNNIGVTVNTSNLGEVITSNRNSPWGIAIRSRHWQWGIDLRPGLILNCSTLFYGRIGFAINKILTNSQFTFTDNTASFFPTQELFVLNLENKKRKTRANLRAGLGIEQPVCECLNLRADYIYTRYRRIKNSGSISFSNSFFRTEDFFSVNAISLSQSYAAKLENHSFLVGLSYYW